MRTPIKIDYDAIIESKTSGPYKIIRELPSIRMGSCVKRMVEVQFIKTGTIKQSQLAPALSGSIKDEFYPSIFGVGYLGNYKHLAYTKKEYDMWFHMLSRCYNPNNEYYENYGGAGVTVDPRWFSFENFIFDLPTLPGYSEYAKDINKVKYQLDKDALQQNVPVNNRIYSKDTCMILPVESNARLPIIDKKPSTSSTYYGVYRLSDSRFQSSINVDGVKYFLGTYSNELAAASVYNFVAERCCKAPLLNDRATMMPINTALQYRTSRTPLKLPPNIDMSMLKVPQTTSSPYSGVEKRGDIYVASYFKDGHAICMGTFTDEIAAANAANFGNMFYGGGNSHMNNVPYMQAYEWLQYRTYARDYIAKGEMCRIVNRG